MADLFIAVVGSEALLMLIAIVWAVWKWLGGWPEAHYRIWGIPYFRHVIFEPDGTPYAYILPQSRIHHSVPSFKNRGGEWLVDPENAGRYRGRPTYYHNRGDARAIPVFKWSRIRPDNAEAARWEPIDPELLKAAYDDDSIERARTLGRKLPFPPFYIFAAAVVAVIVAGIAAYYAHDTYCALKPAMC